MIAATVAKDILFLKAFALHVSQLLITFMQSLELVSLVEELARLDCNRIVKVFSTGRNSCLVAPKNWVSILILII